MQMIVGTSGIPKLDEHTTGGAYNDWDGSGPVHAPSTYHRLVPLCVEAEVRRTQGQLPYPDVKSAWSWMAFCVSHAMSALSG